MPNYLLICGAPKSATTSLFRYLSDHPQICPANRKETYFFARAFDYQKVAVPAETAAAFAGYFSHCGETAWRLEATPYTMYAQGAPQRIAAQLPAATLIFVLREPVARLQSDYHFHVQRENQRARGTFAEFVARQRQIQDEMPNLLQLGCYADYLAGFYEVFPRQQIIVLFSEALWADPAGVLAWLSRRLAVDPAFYEQYVFKPQNQTGAVRHKRLNRLRMRLETSVANWRQGLMGRPRLHRIFESLVVVGKDLSFRLTYHPRPAAEPVDDDTLAALRAYYRPANAALARLLGQPLPWPDTDSLP